MEEDQSFSNSPPQITESSFPQIDQSCFDEDTDVVLDFSDLFIEESDVEAAMLCEGEIREEEALYEGEDDQIPRVRKRKELSNDERRHAYSLLLEHSFNNRLPKFLSTAISQQFETSPKSILRLWKRGKESGTHNVSNRRANSGRHKKEHDLERVKDVALQNRTTLRCLSTAIAVPKTTLFKRLRDKELKRHTNAIHPILTEGNRYRRIEHCLYMIDPTTVPSNPHFLNMDNIIHIDEKWFNMTKKTVTYYLRPGEKVPIRSCKSTKFTPKIMFLAAVARPRYDSQGICTFDGKIGVFPLIDMVAAVRNSVNRPAGTLEPKPKPNITRAVIRDFMINKILPAIKEKWPTDSIRESIFIQQDNAKTHIKVNDEVFLTAAQNLGLNIQILCQPPNSPDLNVLDLGFFRAIQSLQEKEGARTVAQLIAAVEKSFAEFSSKKSNYIFITLQSCMKMILSTLGSNAYDIPHLQKDHLERLAILPLTLTCDMSILDAAIAHLPH